MDVGTAPSRHALPNDVSLVLAIPPDNKPLHRRAADWLCPWTAETFPGFRKFILGLFPRPMTWTATQHWASGRTPLPPDIADALADAIAQRRRAGQQLEEELRQHAAAIRARPPQRYGWARVDESTGRDKRGNWKR